VDPLPFQTGCGEEPQELCFGRPLKDSAAPFNIWQKSFTLKTASIFLTN